MFNSLSQLDTLSLKDLLFVLLLDTTIAEETVVSSSLYLSTGNEEHHLIRLVYSHHR
jgi:hypothetical protein